MANEPRLILQLPRGGSLERQLSARGPAAVSSGEVVVELGLTDALGNLRPPDAGEVVLSVPSPQALLREPDAVRRVIAGAGTGVEPLVLVVEAAEELRDEELAAILGAAGHSRRAVILRVIRNG
jgi:hypothetical protein